MGGGEDVVVVDEAASALALAGAHLQHGHPGARLLGVVAVHDLVLGAALLLHVSLHRAGVPGRAGHATGALVRVVGRVDLGGGLLVLLLLLLVIVVILLVVFRVLLFLVVVVLLVFVVVILFVRSTFTVNYAIVGLSITCSAKHFSFY